MLYNKHVIVLRSGSGSGARTGSINRSHQQFHTTIVIAQ